MNHKPTPEQEAIIRGAASGQSFMAIAGAGTAKTTTLKMLSSEVPHQKVLALAFNKRIVASLQEAMPEHFVVKTLNGLGHSAWQKQRGRRLEVDAYKVGTLVSEYFKKNGIVDETGELWTAIKNLVNFMRNHSWVPEAARKRGPRYKGPDPRETGEYDEFLIVEGVDFQEDYVWNLGEEILTQSIEQAFNCFIDFDDQIYMSTCFPSVYEKYDALLVDEAQDLSPANHRQIILCRPNQVIAVGDPKQAIYGFRGADYTSMDNLEIKIQTELGISMARYPLATTFRCPKKVVERQHGHYPEYRAFESNKEGEITALTKWEVADISYGAAIICRNNAPLVALAFNLLKNRRGFTYIGVDMAKNLKSLVKKVAGLSGKTLNNSQKAISQDTLLTKLGLWFEAERARILAKGKMELESSLRDRKECARMIILECKNLGEAMDLCDAVFGANAEGLTLATGHRAKGLEWDDVWFLDPWRIPSKYANKLAAQGIYGQMRQEHNLRYVIETRTSNRLTFFNLDDCTDQDALHVEQEGDNTDGQETGSSEPTGYVPEHSGDNGRDPEKHGTSADLDDLFKQLGF